MRREEDERQEAEVDVWACETEAVSWRRSRTSLTVMVSFCKMDCWRAFWSSLSAKMAEMAKSSLWSMSMEYELSWREVNC
jgi:hypothetical protein